MRLLKLLQEIKVKFNLSYLSVPHDLSIISTLSNRIAVVYKGRLIEEAETMRIIGDPLHPYKDVNQSCYSSKKEQNTY